MDYDRQKLDDIERDIKALQIKEVTLKWKQSKNTITEAEELELAIATAQLSDLKAQRTYWQNLVRDAASTERISRQKPQPEPCLLPFFNNIANATEMDDWLSFGQPIPSSELNQLYIRDSFRMIADSMQPGINKAIITGTPGIGKSLFLIYLLWRLVRERKRVLFVYHPFIIYYDGQGGVFRYSNASPPSDTDDNFWNPNLWCLFDCKNKNESDLGKFPYELCTFVLSTSPRREMVNDFKKPPEPQIYYMPLWSQEELELIAPCFPHEQDWRERFRILGGIPRYVLEATKNGATEILQEACKQCDLADCTKIIDSLVHITSTAPFTSSSVTYASATALDIIVQYKGAEARRKLAELLSSSYGNPLTASLCGYIFEPYAIELLERGGNFVCRQLVHGNKKIKPDEETLQIPVVLVEHRMIPFSIELFLWPKS